VARCSNWFTQFIEGLVLAFLMVCKVLAVTVVFAVWLPSGRHLLQIRRLGLDPDGPDEAQPFMSRRGNDLGFVFSCRRQPA
jgi:hypothetical protein